MEVCLHRMRHKVVAMSEMSKGQLCHRDPGLTIQIIQYFMEKEKPSSPFMTTRSHLHGWKLSETSKNGFR